MSKEGYEHLRSTDTDGQEYGFAARVEQAGGSGCQAEEAGHSTRGVEQMAGAPVLGYPVMTPRATMAMAAPPVGMAGPPVGMAGPPVGMAGPPLGMVVHDPLALGRRGRRRGRRQRRGGPVTAILRLVRTAVHSSKEHYQKNHPPPPGPSYQ